MLALRFYDLLIDPGRGSGAGTTRPQYFSSMVQEWKSWPLVYVALADLARR